MGEGGQGGEGESRTDEPRGAGERAHGQPPDEGGSISAGGHWKEWRLVRGEGSAIVAPMQNEEGEGRGAMAADLAERVPAAS